MTAQRLSRDRSATFFQNFSDLFETSKKSCLTVGRRSRDLRQLSPDRLATFFKISPICLKRQEKVVRQSADGVVKSNDCRVTVQRLFSIFSDLLETSRKSCLRVDRRSRDLRRLSRDRSATFFKISPFLLTRRNKLFNSQPPVA